MIVSLRGILEARGPDWVQVAVGGVGVQVFVPTSTQAALGALGEAIHLHTHLLVREDTLHLFGFATPEERAAFLALQEVTGVGPRLALAVLSTLTPQRLATAVEAGDVEALARVPGVGKRTASRLAVELKGKLEELALGEAVLAYPPDPDLLAALLALGYSQAEARQGMGLLPAEERGVPLEDRLRRVLRAMGSR